MIKDWVLGPEVQSVAEHVPGICQKGHILEHSVACN
jgi:hypothetical protein